MAGHLHNGEQTLSVGAYAYKLRQGSKSNPEDGNWYLRSNADEEPPIVPPVIDPVIDPPVVNPLYQAGASTYEALPNALLSLNKANTLRQRIGDRVFTSNVTDIAETPEDASTRMFGTEGFWSRIEGGNSKLTPKSSTTELTLRQNEFKLQAGVDGTISENDQGYWIGGIYSQYLNGKTKIKSIHGNGQIATDGYGIGGTLTFYGNDGFYFDAQANANWYSSDLNSPSAQVRFKDGLDGFGYALSAEVGKSIAIDEHWSYTPQAQLSYSDVKFDRFVDVFDAPVSFEKGASLRGRLGVTLDYASVYQDDSGRTNKTNFYGVANLYSEFLGNTRINLAGVDFSTRNERIWGGLGVGGSHSWNNDQVTLFGELLVDTSLNNIGKSHDLKGNIGLRVKW